MYIDDDDDHIFIKISTYVIEFREFYQAKEKINKSSNQQIRTSIEN